MEHSSRAPALLSFLLSGGALFLGVQAEMSWLVAAGIGLLGANVISARLALRRVAAPLWNGGLMVTWGLALILPASFFLSPERNGEVEGETARYAAVLAWLVAVLFPPINSGMLKPGLTAHLRVVSVALAFFAGGLLIVIAWSHNLSAAFHVGLLIGLVLMILCRLWFRLRPWSILLTNTLLLICISLPVVDFFVRPQNRPRLRAEELKNYYSPEAARKNPDAFAHWWRFYNEEWHRFANDLIMQGPRLRPNGRSRFVDCEVAINSRGFRGKEISAEKGNAYRIVALGESTTFGITMNATDRPWPELLEEIIRVRLKPSRPVEVINAGIPAITLPENLERMKTDILPLRPDLIVSYHGINAFALLNKALPPMRGEAPPRYIQRPLKLVADAEFRLKMIAYERRTAVFTNQPVTKISNPMETDYGKAYRQLIEIAKTNDIRLVLANFSMAVNSRSDRSDVEFYRTGFPPIYGWIAANATHTRLIDQLVQENPGVLFVDTQRQLDGNHGFFIDLVHFSPKGEQAMAEIFFAAIKNDLERDFVRADLTRESEQHSDHRYSVKPK